MDAAGEIRRAIVGDADLVGKLVAALLDELYGADYGEERLPIYRAAAAELLPDEDLFVAFLAITPKGKPVGLLTCHNASPSMPADASARSTSSMSCPRRASSVLDAR
jgi:hypothetical protein